ncbi:MAG TPA: PucR family transcriptional regulator ligand-binding domain-containing protein [Candidatus Limnocylindrales bacterium]|nr:PucR family transcriptional regulator ligand-binding domain-containing protein [Candidatus Limnocylindrales bacterium]
MLTVADALSIEAFAGARVVAGDAGLARAVGWVHVAGVPDAPQWLNGGELVLTTPLNMPAAADEQLAYLQAMIAKGVVGLAMTVGRYAEHIAPALRHEADAAGFPLIEVPYQARFVDIAREVNQRITQANMATTERALMISRVLTQLVLDGGDLQQLAETLAELVGQSISIENERFEILASHNIADYDEARRYTLSQGRTDPRLVQALETRGVLADIRRTLRPAYLPQMPDVGLEMERILAPIVVQGEIYGYMWIIAGDRPLADLDRMAIESGATIAALMLLYQDALQSAEASLKGGLLSQLIQGQGERKAVLADQALRYDVSLAAPYVMLVVDWCSPEEAGAPQHRSQKLLQLYRRINRVVSAGRWNAVVGQFAGQVVVLAQASEETAALADAIHARAEGEDVPLGALRVAVSAPQRGAERAALAHQQCQDALYIAARLHDSRRTISFDDLGYLHALYHAGAASLNANPYAPALRALLRDQGPDLFRTLEVYLDVGGNGVQSAEQLTIHRSTLNYRLDRIAAVCACNLSDPLVRTNLQVALKLLRLFEVE